MDTRVYFTCVFDLLEQDIHPCYLAVAEALEKNPARPVFFFHPLQYLFEGYRDLLLGKFTPEDFVALGDVTSVKPLFSSAAPLDAEMCFEAFCQQVETQPDLYKDALVLVMGDEKKCVVSGSVGEHMKNFKNLGITVFFDASA